MVLSDGFLEGRWEDDVEQKYTHDGDGKPYIKDIHGNKYDPTKMSDGQSDFSEDDLAQLQFVAKARKFSFSIQECEELLSLYSDKNRSSKEVKALTLEKISEIDAKLIELKDLRHQLSFLANNCKGNDRPECPILDALADV